MPSLEMRNKIKKELIENNIFTKNIEESPEKINKIKKFKNILNFERLSPEAMATSSFYAELTNIPIFLGDIPELVFRENIANSFTLMQLQNVFTHTSREIALYPDLNPQTPLNMAFYLYPDIFLQPSDKYMVTMLEYLLKRYERITVLVGYAQSDSILTLFNNRKVSSLEKELQQVSVKNNFVNELSPEEIIEKHSILDVMFYGKDIIENMENYDFQTTYKMIKKYGDQLYTDSMSFGKMRLFHHECLQKYAKYCKQEFEEGKKILKREFLRKKASEGY